MKVVLEVASGMRIQTENFYKQNSYWYPKYKGQDKPSHLDLAKLLEFKHHPIQAFFGYLNSNTFYAKGSGTTILNPKVKSRFTSMFLSAFIQSKGKADGFRAIMEPRLDDSWKNWLSNNLGRFRTAKAKNPNPNFSGKKTALVDTKQYLDSISFQIKYVGQDKINMNLLYKYYSTEQSRKELVSSWTKDPEGILAEPDFDSVTALGI